MQQYYLKNIIFPGEKLILKSFTKRYIFNSLYMPQLFPSTHSAGPEIPSISHIFTCLKKDGVEKISNKIKWIFRLC